MNKTFKRIMFFILAVLFGTLSLQSALAYHYSYPDSTYSNTDSPYYGYAPIYRTGYVANTWTYGFSGWDYNRVYYRYHYPYSTNRYNSYYPPGTWVAHYAYRTYPMYVGYPFPGYYW